MNNYQRDVKSNSYYGKEFEKRAKIFLDKKFNVNLEHKFSIQVGIDNKEKKGHDFDLGSKEGKIIVECKSHRWTKSRYVPSAKMTVWNEAMYYFLLVKVGFKKKILFVERDYNKVKKMTLAGYYFRHYRHLIPKGVEIWEFDMNKKSINPVRIFKKG